MQFLFDLEGRASFIADIHARLDVHFACPRHVYVRLGPVSQMVMSSLGGRTKSHVSKAAFMDIFEAYGSWAAVRDAAKSDLLHLARRVTFAEDKVPRLQRALRLVTDGSGAPSLARLKPLSTRAAHRYLRSLPGVGRKVAACVLNYSTLARRSLVVNTHHHRVAYRLGLLKKKASFEAAYDALMPLLPAHWSADEIDRHHGLVKALGQTLCRHHETACRLCPLADICPSYDLDSLYEGRGQHHIRHARLTERQKNLLVRLRDCG